MAIEQLCDAELARMDDEEIRAFLSSRGFGVLGLPADTVPYLLPMSYGYDGADALYFTFVVGEGSRKEDLTAATERAAFLVYDAPSAFQWQSVLLTGTIDRLPPDERDDIAAIEETAWRPDVFERADTPVAVYRFRIEDADGYKHTGLPPGFAGE